MTHAASTDDKTSTNGRDTSAEPDSPTELTKPSWVYVVRKTVREFSDDRARTWPPR